MTLKKSSFILCGFMAALLFSGYKHSGTGYKNFEVSYMAIGLGSNFTSMQPVFRVKGLKFIYTSEQTTYYEGQSRKKADTLMVGDFRKSSADSIIKLIQTVKDTLVYRSNIHVMSGGIHAVNIKSSNKSVRFDLHNASDTTVRKIVAILNTYVSDPKRKLWLFDY